jgi:hypothetical protein
MTKLQAHDFEVDNLLYTIIGTNPPTVSLDGHVDGTSASDELWSNGQKVGWIVGKKALMDKKWGKKAVVRLVKRLSDSSLL